MLDFTILREVRNLAIEIYLSIFKYAEFILESHIIISRSSIGFYCLQKYKSFIMTAKKKRSDRVQVIPFNLWSSFIIVYSI